MANLSFTNAYQVNATTTPAGKEANSHDFIYTALGTATIDDDTNSVAFSGNDVAAIGINIGGVTYYGWISRPIKNQGDVKAFYFWTDPGFTSLALATADGNQDGDSDASDNIGFILVVEQSYFDALGAGHAAGDILNVGSSSDRVDSALNSLLTANAAPVAVADSGTAVEAGGLNNASAGSSATGNILVNDTDANAGDTKAVTLVGTSSAGASVTAGTTSANGTVVAGQYGSITVGADGSYSYAVANGNATIEALRTSSNTLADTFTYTMKDTAGLTSTTTLTVTIQGANDTPIAVNDNNVAKESTTTALSGFTSAGATATGNVLTNDTDKDSGDGRTVSGTAGTVDTSGGVTTNGTYKFYIPGGAASTFNPVGVGDEAWVVIGGTGYALYADAAGTTKVNVTSAWDATNLVFTLNAQPLYYYDTGTSTIKAVSTLAGGTLNGTTVGFKNDATNTAVSTTTSGMKSGALDATNGIQVAITGSTVSVSSPSIDGAIAFGMSVTGAGVPASTVITGITYDGSGNVSTITVNKELTSSSGTRLTFAGSAGATLTGHYGTLVLNANGTYTYTPFTDITSLSAGQSGTDTFKYAMADTAGATSTATLTITVLGAGSNDPVAVADTGTATETGISSGSNPSGNLITNDTGLNRIVSGARSVDSSSETSILATDTTVTGRYGTLTVKQDGTWSYALDNANATVNALNSGGTLSDVFLYRDTNSPTSTGSSVSTLTVTVNGADDAPVAAADSATAIEAGGLGNANAGLNPTGNVLSNDTDVDNTAAQLSVTAVRLGSTANAGAAGTLGSALVGTYGSLTLSSTGAWTYAVDNTHPAVNALAAGGTLTDSFNYTLSDGSGGTATANAVLSITIQGAADTIAVNSVFVNEASDYAVFTVTGAPGVAVTLALSDTTGLAASDVKADLVNPKADIGSTLQYFNGATWTNYHAGTPPSIPAGGQLFVRVAVVSDSVYEGNESFSLTATTTSADATSATGIGTVNDERQGDIFLSNNNTGTANASGGAGYPTLDDDRPTISVTSPSITEGTAAEFTASIDKLSNFDIAFTPVLAGVSAALGTDTAADSALQVSTDGGANWNTVTGPVTIAAGQSSLTLRLATTDDSETESTETFTLSTGYIDGVKNQSGATGTAGVADNDSAGLTLSNASRTTSESETQQSFTVRLNSQPGSDVTITITGLDASEGSLSTTTLTFTSANWDQAQSVTITGVDDAIDDGDIGYTLTLTSSGDGAYEGANAQTGSVIVTNTDDDAAGLTVSQSTLTTNEGGSQASFTVKLDTQPMTDVTVTITGLDATEGSLSATTLTFTSANWNTPQIVAVTGGNDSAIDGGIGYTLTLTTSGDAAYDGAHSQSATVVVTNEDDDVASPPATLRVQGVENLSEGANAVFTVTLGPASASVTSVNLELGSSSDTAKAGDYAGTLVAYYWDAGSVRHELAVSQAGSISLPAGVTVFYVSVATTADAVYEGGETFTLVATLSTGAGDADTTTIVDNGSGHEYDSKGLPIGGAADDDRPLLIVAGTSGVSEGSNAIFEVTLAGTSEAPLEIALTLGGGGDSTDADDYVPLLVAYYFDGGGTRHLLSVVDGKVVLPVGVSAFFVSVPTRNDSPEVFEGSETLTLSAGVSGRAASSGTSTVVDDGSGQVHDDHGNPTGEPVDDDRRISADLDPDSDNGQSNDDRITSIIQPEFTINAGTLLQAGQTVQLVAPDGSIVGSAIVTAEDVAAGTVNVPAMQLDDGTYVFIAQILGSDGHLVGEAPVTVTIVTDHDGVQPSVELTANGGDFNHDGIADWEQNNVAQLPLASVADHLAGVNAPGATFGAIMAGTVNAADPAGPVQLDPTAQLLDLGVAEQPAPLPAGFVSASAMINFSVTSQEGQVLQDLDASRAGLQTRVVIDLPFEVRANTFIKWIPHTATWFEFLDDGNLQTFDDGATLLDFDNDGLIDRVVVTLTDGGIGDEDGVANGVIVDPGMLALKAGGGGGVPSGALPVYSVLLAGGDRFYTTDAHEAAVAASGTSNVFEGVRFDTLDAADGGQALLANYNPITGDWYFAVEGGQMPYMCYQRMPGAGFQAAAPGQGPGADFHLFINRAGQTQLVTLEEAAKLDLANTGFIDRGTIFKTTAESAFAFDAQGYLVHNHDDLGIQALVQALAASYGSSTDAGFVEAVEQHFLAQVQVTGLPHGGDATAAELNAAFGTAFAG